MAKKKTNGKDILEELLKLEESNLGNSTDFDDLVLSDKFVIDKLKEKANAGDIRALELLGKHLKIFDKDSEKGNELIDIFAEEGSIEDNILKFLDIMEDKYAEELEHSVPMLINQDDLYLDEKEKSKLLRQLTQSHERNIHRDLPEIEAGTNSKMSSSNSRMKQFRDDIEPLDPLRPRDEEEITEQNIFRV